MWATEWFLKWEIKTLVDKLRDKEEYIKKLEEEVKDLVERNIELDKKYILVLAENKKLKANNEYRNKIVDIIPQDEKSVAEETIQDLQERIRFLEQCLDNKENVNKSLREENKRLSDFLECEA